MQRLDTLLVDKGLVATRTLAQKLIDADLVEYREANLWRIASKASIKLSNDIDIRVGEHPDMRYVSRAGLKLEAALQSNNINVKDKVAIDVGQSTGGFTDCLLKHGIKRVIGIEVGKEQLAPQIRQDPRVICLEGVNARYLTQEMLNDKEELDGLPDWHNGFDLAVMDVSFISQKKILPNLSALLKPKGILISLVKPQFEVGPQNLSKGGIVKDKTLLTHIKKDFCEYLEALNFNVLNYQESPIKGGDGNREFLLVAEKAS